MTNSCYFYIDIAYEAIEIWNHFYNSNFKVRGLLENYLTVFFYANT